MARRGKRRSISGLKGGPSRRRKRARRAPRSVTQVKRSAGKAGSHWFDKSTMRFFKTRVHDRYYRAGACGYFVTSESHSGDYGDRRYTIRKFCNGDRNPSTVGDFQAYKSRSGAHSAAKRIAEFHRKRLKRTAWHGK